MVRDKGGYTIAARAGASETSIGVQRLEGDRYSVEIKSDEREFVAELDASGPLDSGVLERAFKEGGVLPGKGESLSGSLALLAELNARTLREGLRRTGTPSSGGILASAKGGKTQAECQEEYEDDLESAGANLVVSSAVTSLGLAAGWSGVGLGIALVGALWTAHSTDSAVEDAEEEYEECKKNATDAPPA